MVSTAKELAKPRVRLCFESPSDFDPTVGNYGRSVGPRRGPFARRAYDREDWCLRRLLVAERLTDGLRFPFRLEGFHDEPGYPDFVLTTETDSRAANGEPIGVEVVEATEQASQREMTEYESAPVRFPTGGVGEASEREERGIRLIIRALRDKVTKAHDRHYSAVRVCELVVCFSEREVPVADMDTLAMRVILRANNEGVDYRTFSHIHFVRQDEVVLLRADTDRVLVDLGSAYETDYFRWSAQQATALRERNAARLDFVNLAEEIESLGRRDRGAVRSQLRRLLLHLLKWRHQSAQRSHGWTGSIGDAREEILELTGESPSLLAMLERPLSEIHPEWKSDLTVIEDAYRRARKGAARETGLPIETFPEVCPFTLNQILDEDFLPEGNHGDD